MKFTHNIREAGFLRRFRDILRSDDSGGLWKRNLIVLSVAQFIAMVGMMAAVPFLPLYIRQLGVEDMASAQIWSGLIFSGPFFLSMITVPIWGSLGDRYGRKMMVGRALIGLALAVSLMGLVQNVFQLMALRIIQGAVSGFVAASLSFVSANTPDERSGFAISMLQSSIAAGNIVGPLAGGVISDIVGIRPVFIIIGGLCLISGLVVAFALREDKTTVGTSRGIAIFRNLRYVREHKMLLYILILILISQGGIFFTNPIFAFFVEQKGAPEEYISSITGALFGIVGLFMIFFAPRWGRRNDLKDFRKTLIVASGGLGFLMALHILAPDYIYLFPIRAAAGVFVAGIQPTLFSALSKRSPVESRGGIMGLASSATIIGSFVSFNTCGIVAATFGMDATFVISAGMLGAVAAGAALLRGREG
ncbi:MAG: MFS transporter [Candidatus Kapaibacterium sp.]